MKVTTFPLTERFENITGAEDGVTIEVRQAREGEHIQRQQLFAKTTRIFDTPELGEVGMGDSVRLEMEQNNAKIRRAEAYLTLARVAGVVDESDQELFKTADTVDGPCVKGAMTEEAFNLAWNRLPTRVTRAISQKVWEVNPQWSPDYEGE